MVVQPGDVVVTDFNFGPMPYQHWSLVSDRKCGKGQYMLISATDRTGTVQEETWDVVTQGKKTYVADIQFNTSLSELLGRARTQIGSWDYCVRTKNCEHFIKWAGGLKVTSAQVRNGVGAGVATVAVVAVLAEKPTALKYLGGFVLAAGIAVALTKAAEKTD
ncbi:lecithin retinol acyltransferase family protein [Endozoicomonas numazuensis]|uniref:Membrane protein n=1 Tax=Endozoicomonas numazuensis TaxID=1137799 RepID=A0A081NI32_9GAMM|nr:lecithin retinol acyltransferase family protein [Endozoicomonas numazuensis]KEQ18105.1 membrane protein [Endozoicomonas numazuensis]